MAPTARRCPAHDMIDGLSAARAIKHPVWAWCWCGLRS